MMISFNSMESSDYLNTPNGISKSLHGKEKELWKKPKICRGEYFLEA